MLSADSAVGTRRRHVAAYLYAYSRILELACSWTMHVPDTRFKVALGRKIGLDGLAIERLSRRITQMATATARGAAPASYARWLDAHHGETDAGRIAAILVATIDDLHRSLSTYVAKTHHGDEPTRLMLLTLLSDLQVGRDTLAPFARGTVDPPSIDAGDAPVNYTGEEPLLPIPDFPARPANFVREEAGPPPPPLTVDQMMAPDHVAKSFRRMYIEIEICAVEVCSRNIIEYRQMPHAFKVDMSQQIWDEARHAELAQDVFEKLGLELGDLAHTGAVWTRHAAGVDLAERLAIEQVVQEGNSVDKAFLMIDILRKYNHHDAADAIEWLTADETQHALIGNRWLMRLCDNKREKYEAVVAAAQAKIKFPLSPVNRTLREIGGFPEWQIDALEREFAAARQGR
jgi:uncharacterized ferritin-like protein (DUF455 family)